jgi:hypothetical protein
VFVAELKNFGIDENETVWIREDEAVRIRGDEVLWIGESEVAALELAKPVG